MNDGNDHENPFRLTLIREKKQTTNQSPRRTGLTDHAKRPPSPQSIANSLSIIEDVQLLLVFSDWQEDADMLGHRLKSVDLVPDTACQRCASDCRRTSSLLN